jgi:uncharacterized protein (DUF58 family)
LASLQFDPRRLVEGNLAGAHKSPLAGFAVEFAGHREYVPGDDPRHIDWRVYYNRDKFFVKQYEMETNFVCHIVLDISGSMRYGQGPEKKIVAAARLAAVLGYAILRQNDKVALGTVDQQVRDYLPPSDSLAQMVRVTELLDDVTTTKKTHLGPSLNDLAGRFGRREIVLIMSDFFCDLPDLESAVQRLRYQQHEVILFQILHNDEWEFELAGLTQFVGCESDESLVADPHDLRARYLDAVRKQTGDVRAIAERNGGEYLFVNTRRDFGELLADYLQRRQHANHNPVK